MAPNTKFRKGYAKTQLRSNHYLKEGWLGEKYFLHAFGTFDRLIVWKSINTGRIGRKLRLSHSGRSRLHDLKKKRANVL